MRKLINTKQFIENLKIKRTDKGEYYDYSLVDYKNSKIKITIICPYHGQFKQTPSEHLYNRGCKYCGNNKISLKRKKYKNNADFIIALKNNRIDKGEYYDYSLVDYKNIIKKIIIICPIHGQFEQTPLGHFKNYGCRDCSNKNQRKCLNQILPIVELKKGKILEIDDAKCNIAKIRLSCYHGHEWSTKINIIIAGHWCPICAKKKNSGEKITRKIIEAHYNEYFPSTKPNFLKNPKTNKNLELDMFNDKLKLAFEYNGFQHYQIKKFKYYYNLNTIKYRDKLKNRLCKLHDITLITIPQIPMNSWNIKDMYEYLKNYLKDYNIDINLDINKINFDDIYNNDNSKQQKDKLISQIENCGGKFISGNYVNIKSKFKSMCNCGNIVNAKYTQYFANLDSIPCKKCQMKNQIIGIKLYSEHSRKKLIEFLCEKYNATFVKMIFGKNNIIKGIILKTDKFLYMQYKEMIDSKNIPNYKLKKKNIGIIDRYLTEAERKELEK